MIFFMAGLTTLLRVAPWRRGFAFAGGLSPGGGALGAAKAIFVAAAAFADANASPRAPARASSWRAPSVTQMLRVVAIDRAEHPRQLVVGADPDLHEHVVVDERHHVVVVPPTTFDWPM
jgi:hypothetical protein